MRCAVGRVNSACIDIFGKSSAGLAGGRQDAQHRHCSLNALRSARQINGRSVGSSRTAMATSYHEMCLRSGEH